MQVLIRDESIEIYDAGKEIISWHVDEWNEDPSIVPGIVTAVKLAYSDPAELRKTLALIQKN